MKNITNKIDYSLIEVSLNNQLKQFLSGFGSVPEVEARQYRNVVIVGMGGSRLPAEILINTFADRLLMPITLVSDYSIASALLTKETLVIAISYSGGTEEVLSAARQASLSSGDLYTISSGGDLAKVKAKANIIFSTDDNPSRQPRYGVGYMFGGLLGLFQSLKIIDLSLKEMKDSLVEAEKEAKLLKKQFTKIIEVAKNKVPVFIAAEHLAGLLPMMQNQIHETAKNFACQFSLPNLNHHLLEGLANPKSMMNKFYFIVFDSSLYFQRNSLRAKLTAQIIKKQSLNQQIIKINGSNKLTQTLSLLSVCGETSLGLSKYNKVDPAIVPWVDYFKKKME